MRKGFRLPCIYHPIRTKSFCSALKVSPYFIKMNSTKIQKSITSNPLVQFCFISFCILFLIFLVSKRAQPFFDSYIFYTAGSLFNNGQDVYNQDLFREKLYDIVGHRNIPEIWISYAYPPQTTLIFSLFARFPFEVAHKIASYVNSLLLIFNLCLTGYILSRYKSLKMIDFCLLSSFLLTGFAYENITNSQLGIFISTLLLCTYIFAQKGKSVLAAVSLAITSVKPSFLPFFLIYFLIQRQYLSILYCLAFSALFTVVPLLISGMPIISTLTNWLTVLSSWGSAGNPNSPDPLGEFGFHASMIDLEPLIYRLFNGQTFVAELFLKVMLAIILVYCVWLFLKEPEKGKKSLLDFGLVSVIAMLFVYHRRYDIFLLFPGFLYIYLHSLECEQSYIRKFWTYLLGVVILLTSFVDIFFAKMSSTLVFLQASYLWKLILPLPWAGVITLAALLFLKTQSRLSKALSKNTPRFLESALKRPRSE